MGKLLGRLLFVALAIALLCGLIAYKGGDVKSSCTYVSTPGRVTALDGTAGVGDLIHDASNGPRDTARTVLFVWKWGDYLSTLWNNVKDHAQGRPEGDVATGWRNDYQAKKEAAEAACNAANDLSPCPESPPPPPVTPPPADGSQPEFDPKSAAISTGQLTGKQLAADALRKAGFPESAIPLGVAIAFYESTFDPTAANSSDHVGLWQISGPNARTLNLGDRRDPYVNARYAKAIYDGRGGTWSKDWSVYRTALAHVDEYADLAAAGGLAETPGRIDPDPGTGCATGMVAELNPAGSSSWQGAVYSGSSWFVAGDEQAGIVFHRMGNDQAEADQMVLVDGDHPYGFGVVDSTVFTSCSGRVVKFGYKPGKSIRCADTIPTKWQGQISIEPGGAAAIVRQGNRYQQVSMGTGENIGNPVTGTVATGPLQGFSSFNGTLYLLSGGINDSAALRSYSLRTGEHLATRDVTNYGLEGESGKREPEGMWGAMIGVKVFRGSERRLRVINVTEAPSVAAVAPTPTKWDSLNPRTPSEAVAYLRSRMPSKAIPGFGIQGHCEGYMNRAYGRHGGYADAKSHWLAPGPKSSNTAPPLGAVVYFDTSNYHGHVALSAGGGRVISTDYDSAAKKYRAGVIGEGTLEDVSRAMGGKVLGWRAPDFDGESSRGVAA